MYCSLRVLAGAERGSRSPQGHLNRPHTGMRASEHAASGSFQILEGPNGLAEVVERRAGIPIERLRVNFLLRKMMPVARRVFGESHQTTLTMRWIYAEALYMDIRVTLDDLREAVTALEESERIARRVFSGAHPMTKGMKIRLRKARAALRARETPSLGSS